MSVAIVELLSPFSIPSPDTIDAAFDIFTAKIVQKKKDVTPELLRRNKRYHIYGYRYELFPHEDGTGTLSLNPNTPISWATVLKEKEGIVDIYGKHIFTIGDESIGYELFPILRRDKTAIEVLGGVIWQP